MYQSDSKTNTINTLLKKHELINATVISSASLFFLIYFVV